MANTTEKATEAKAAEAKATEASKKPLSLGIRVLEDGKRVVIKACDIDTKKHLHISGRGFSADEIKAFKK